MYRRVLNICLCLLQLSATSQDDSLYYDNYNRRGDIGSFNLCYGNLLLHRIENYPFNKLNSYEFGNAIEYVGLSMDVTYGDPFTGDELLDSKESHSGGFRISYYQILPSGFNLIPDSGHNMLRGGIFSYAAGVDLTYQSKFSSVLLGFGFSTGRLVARLPDNSSKRNPFFAPAVFLDPKFFFGNLSITFSIGYQWDVSSKNWKNRSKSDVQSNIELPSIRLSGLSANVGIGWKF